MDNNEWTDVDIRWEKNIKQFGIFKSMSSELGDKVNKIIKQMNWWERQRVSKIKIINKFLYVYYAFRFKKIFDKTMNN